MNAPLKAVGTLAGIGAGALAWALVEAQAYTLRRVVVPVLPAGARAFKVLHISDLHFVPSQRRKVEWVRSLAELAPDYVVVTGDNLSHMEAVPTVAEALEPLLGVPGAYVFGSNDYYAPVFKSPLRYFRGPSKLSSGVKRRLPTDDLDAVLSSGGWKNLNNARGVDRIGDVSVRLVGLNDPHIRRDRMPKPVAEGADADLVFGVVHAPYLRALDALKRDGADVVFAGHTHGGQVCIPGYGALVTNCDLDTGRVKGLSRWPIQDVKLTGQQQRGNIWLHVSAGLGASRFAPIRFACRPEATLLTLVPREA